MLHRSLESEDFVDHFSMSQFREKGYQLFNNVISPEVVALLYRVLASEVDRILVLLGRVGVEPDISNAARDIVALLNSPSANRLDRDTRVLMTGHFPTELRLSETFWEIPRTRALQDILKAALGSDRLRMHMPPMARFILPNNSEAGVPPHLSDHVRLVGKPRRCGKPGPVDIAILDSLVQFGIELLRVAKAQQISLADAGP